MDPWVRIPFIHALGIWCMDPWVRISFIYELEHCSSMWDQSCSNSFSSQPSLLLSSLFWSNYARLAGFSSEAPPLHLPSPSLLLSIPPPPSIFGICPFFWGPVVAFLCVCCCFWICVFFGKPNFFFLIAGMIGMGAMMNQGLVVFLRVWWRRLEWFGRNASPCGFSERLLEEEGGDDDDDDTVVSSGKIYLAVWWSGSGCVLGGARGWQGI